MITLSNIDGDTLQIGIAGYQYPDPDGYHWDLNWLSVNVRWQRAEAIWQASDPCLSTEELLDLLDWFRQAQQGKQTNSSLEFMEPCLKFESLADKETPRLRVYLRHELHPGKSLALPAILQSIVTIVNQANEDGSFWLEFPLSATDILSAVMALQGMIDQFPVRIESAQN